MVTAPDYQPLFYWVREREGIRQRKDAQMQRPLWTQDGILSAYRFCNVRREDDRVTAWVRLNIRQRFVGHPHLWLMLAIARQINRPDTLAELIGLGALPFGEELGAFDPARITAALNDRKARGLKV